MPKYIVRKLAWIKDPYLNEVEVEASSEAEAMQLAKEIPFDYSAGTCDPSEKEIEILDAKSMDEQGTEYTIQRYWNETVQYVDYVEVKATSKEEAIRLASEIELTHNGNGDTRVRDFELSIVD